MTDPTITNAAQALLDAEDEMHQLDEEWEEAQERDYDFDSRQACLDRAIAARHAYTNARKALRDALAVPVVEETGADRMVYVAGPITADPFGCVRTANYAFTELTREGLVPFLPQLSVLAEMVEHRSYEAWLAYDFDVIRHCAAVVRLPGKSPGADKETEFARSLGKPVFALPDDWADLRSWAGSRVRVVLAADPELPELEGGTWEAQRAALAGATPQRPRIMGENIRAKHDVVDCPWRESCPDCVVPSDDGDDQPIELTFGAMGLCSRCHVSACRSEGRLPDLCVACLADVDRAADQPNEDQEPCAFCRQPKHPGEMCNRDDLPDFVTADHADQPTEVADDDQP